MSTQNQVFRIDLGALRNGLEARQKLKRRALAKQSGESSEPRAPSDFNPSRLVNTRGDKGQLLNMVA